MTEVYQSIYNTYFLVYQYVASMIKGLPNSTLKTNRSFMKNQSRIFCLHFFIVPLVVVGM